MDPDRLTAIRAFSQLTEEQEARLLATFATETSLGRGDCLMREGEFSTELWAIEEGTVDVPREGSRLVSLGAGDVVGETGLLSRGPRNADVIATSPVRVFKLTHRELRRMSDDTLRRIEQVMEQRRAAQLAPDPAEQQL